MAKKATEALQNRLDAGAAGTRAGSSLKPTSVENAYTQNLASSAGIANIEKFENLVYGVGEAIATVKGYKDNKADNNIKQSAVAGMDEYTSNFLNNEVQQEGFLSSDYLDNETPNGWKVIESSDDYKQGLIDLINNNEQLSQYEKERAIKHYVPQYEQVYEGNRKQAWQAGQDQRVAWGVQDTYNNIVGDPKIEYADGRQQYETYLKENTNYPAIKVEGAMRDFDDTAMMPMLKQTGRYHMDELGSQNFDIEGYVSTMTAEHNLTPNKAEQLRSGLYDELSTVRKLEAENDPVLSDETRKAFYSGTISESEFIQRATAIHSPATRSSTMVDGALKVLQDSTLANGRNTAVSEMFTTIGTGDGSIYGELTIEDVGSLLHDYNQSNLVPHRWADSADDVFLMNTTTKADGSVTSRTVTLNGYGLSFKLEDMTDIQRNMFNEYLKRSATGEHIDSDLYELIGVVKGIDVGAKLKEIQTTLKNLPVVKSTAEKELAMQYDSPWVSQETFARNVGKYKAAGLITTEKAEKLLKRPGSKVSDEWTGIYNAIATTANEYEEFGLELKNQLVTNISEQLEKNPLLLYNEQWVKDTKAEIGNFMEKSYVKDQLKQAEARYDFIMELDAERAIEDLDYGQKLELQKPYTDFMVDDKLMLYFKDNLTNNLKQSIVFDAESGEWFHETGSKELGRNDWDISKVKLEDAMAKQAYGVEDYDDLDKLQQLHVLTNKNNLIQAHKERDMLQALGVPLWDGTDSVNGSNETMVYNPTMNTFMHVVKQKGDSNVYATLTPYNKLMNGAMGSASDVELFELDIDKNTGTPEFKYASYNPEESVFWNDYLTPEILVSSLKANTEFSYNILEEAGYGESKDDSPWYSLKNLLTVFSDALHYNDSTNRQEVRDEYYKSQRLGSAMQINAERSKRGAIIQARMALNKAFALDLPVPMGY